MKCIKISALILSFIIFLSCPAFAMQLTLGRAKEIAFENNPTPAAARERVVQAVETINQARADYLPVVAMSSSYTYAEKTAVSSSTSENQYTGKISATQVLFQGFYRKYNTQSAVYNKEMNQAGLADAQRILAWSVAQSFLNAQLALENIKIAKSDMIFNQNQEEEALAKERLGAGSYSDVLNYKTKVNAAKSALIMANQEYKEACFGLAALMGYEDSRLPMDIKLIPLKTSKSLDAPDHPGIEIPLVLDSRPDLKQDALAVQEAAAKVKREKSGFFPAISLTGAYGATGVDELTGLNDSDNVGASLGVEVSFELFSGGSTRSAIRRITAEKRELEKELEGARITAANEVRSAVAGVDSARQQLELQRENTQLIQTTRDLVKKEYDAGQASLVRLNEAQNDLVAAQGDLADAQASVILALEELAYYTGANIQQL